MILYSTRVLYLPSFGVLRGRHSEHMQRAVLPLALALGIALASAASEHSPRALNALVGPAEVGDVVVEPQQRRRLAGGAKKDHDGVDHLNDKLFGDDDVPEVWQLLLTSVLCFVVTCFAAVAGIGGGGLLVPLYAIVLGVGFHRGIPISTATIFGVACGNVLFIAREKHPKANRPLIDYATVALMQPGELMGVIIGVLMLQAHHPPPSQRTRSPPPTPPPPPAPSRPVAKASVSVSPSADPDHRAAAEVIRIRARL